MPVYVSAANMVNRISVTDPKSGKFGQGQAHRNSKFTEEQVREIRRRRMEDKTLLKILAHEYNSNEGTMSDICNRKSWRHI